MNIAFQPWLFCLGVLNDNKVSLSYGEVVRDFLRGGGVGEGEDLKNQRLRENVKNKNAKISGYTVW